MFNFQEFMQVPLREEEQDAMRQSSEEDVHSDSDNDDVCSDNDPLEQDEFELEEKLTSSIADSFLSGNCDGEEAIMQATSCHVEQ
jgi:hypothetical protein